MYIFTHFFPPTRTFIVSLLSGAINPISMLAARTVLVEEDDGDMKSDTGVVVDNVGGSNI